MISIATAYIARCNTLMGFNKTINNAVKCASVCQLLCVWHFSILHDEPIAQTNNLLATTQDVNI